MMAPRLDFREPDQHMNPQNTPASTSLISVQRFHFICGLPRSGEKVLAALLNQNPRFSAVSDSAAQPVFADLVTRFADGGEKSDLLDDAQKIALWRSAIGAVHSGRHLHSVLFEHNPDWLPYIDLLVRLYPLSRFLICVRNPAAIANAYELHREGGEDDESQAAAIADLMDEDGEVGSQIAALRAALSSRHAERILVIDYDRLADDPEDVMNVVYDFLREPEFEHDYADLGTPEGHDVSGPVERSNTPMILNTRTILQLSGRAFWRNLKRTSATMMLGRSR